MILRRSVIVAQYFYGVVKTVPLEFSASAATVIENGIKRPIQLLLENKCYPAALILTYSGVEMMAFLNLPRDKRDVTRSDFIDWAEKYMVPLLPQHLTGRDLYGARCGAFRGTDSRLTREGRSKTVSYEGTAKEAITLSTRELVTAFFTGIDSFLDGAQSDEEKAVLVAQRLEQMLETLPF
jgi:hypothetical protein